MILPHESSHGDEQGNVQQTLRDALERSDNLPDHTKCVVLFVNDSTGVYDVRYNCGGGISASQVSTACSYMTALMLRNILDTRPELDV